VIQLNLVFSCFIVGSSDDATSNDDADNDAALADAVCYQCRRHTGFVVVVC
jgi:hypothetical protein